MSLLMIQKRIVDYGHLYNFNFPKTKAERFARLFCYKPNIFLFFRSKSSYAKHFLLYIKC